MIPRALVLAFAALVVAGCGPGARAPALPTTSADAPLPAGARPIGVGPRYQPPPPDGPVRDCRRELGARYGVHLELFGHGLVALFPAGIGTGAPRRSFAGRIERARCYGPLVTLEPTGVVLVRRGTRATLGDFFDVWGEPLGPRRAGAFTGRVRAWVGGRRWRRGLREIPLRRHAQIVLEVGEYVPPHARYVFPPGV